MNTTIQQTTSSEVARALLTEGYKFRKVLELICSNYNEIRFIFKESGFSIIQHNETYEMSCEVNYYSNRITYLFNECELKQGRNSFDVTIISGHISNNLKNITTTSGLTISLTKTSNGIMTSYAIIITPNSEKSDSSITSGIPARDSSGTPLPIFPVYEQQECLFNTGTINFEKFKLMKNEFESYIIIYIMRGKIRFFRKNELNSTSTIYECLSENRSINYEDDEEELNVEQITHCANNIIVERNEEGYVRFPNIFRVKGKIFNSLNNIKTIDKHGSCRVYKSNYKAMKLVVPLGSYGEFSLFFRPVEFNSR